MVYALPLITTLIYRSMLLLGIPQKQHGAINKIRPQYEKKTINIYIVPTRLFYTFILLWFYLIIVCNTTHINRSNCYVLLVM